MVGKRRQVESRGSCQDMVVASATLAVNIASRLSPNCCSCRGDRKGSVLSTHQIEWTKERKGPNFFPSRMAEDQYPQARGLMIL